jgi:phosphate/sulfate permease
VATRIIWAWLLTIPAAGAIGAGTYYLLRLAGAR